MRKILRVFALVLADAVLVSFSGFMSLFLRFEGNFAIEPQGERFLSNLFFGLPLVTAAALVIFFLFGLYRSLWQYAGMSELVRIAAACFLADCAILLFHMFSERPLPRSCYVIWGMLMLFLVGLSRVSFRVLRRLRLGVRLGFISPGGRVMIVGAGSDAHSAINSLDDRSKAVCIADNDPKNRNMLLNGVPVAGVWDDIPKLCKHHSVTEIIVAVPPAQRADVLNICKTTGAKLRVFGSSRARNAELSDLLGRDEVSFAGEAEYLTGKTVLVTGAGGSIGSELCRAVSRVSPKLIVAVDIVENNLYMLEREISGAPFVSVIASIRDKSRIRNVFDRYRPDVVFHAAAHKHVPIMEHNPCECARNNVLGTKNVADAAAEFGVSRFVFISTDKAVNPTNIYGASKRACEYVVSGYKDFVSVRFGNVLGADGSIIPIWSRQIANGGPLTLTHNDITRFYMTIPEAVGLVIQAGALAKGGEVFILDMGKPVYMRDLARDLIRLSGYEPDREIKIEITGLRPGEKLYEELLTAEEGLTSTKYKRIFIGKPDEIDRGVFGDQIKRLQAACDSQDEEATFGIMREMVPSFQPAEDK